MNDRLTSLLELLINEPNDIFLLYGVALEYKSKKQYSNAEKYFKTLLKKDETYVPAYMQYAMLKEEMNEILSSKELYIKGIKIAKEKGDTHAAQEMETFLDELD